VQHIATKRFDLLPTERLWFCLQSVHDPGGDLSRSVVVE
jgi:hypothetical protein